MGKRKGGKRGCSRVDGKIFLPSLIAQLTSDMSVFYYIGWRGQRIQIKEDIEDSQKRKHIDQNPITNIRVGTFVSMSYTAVASAATYATPTPP